MISIMRRYTHNESMNRTTEYNSWADMRGRCKYPKNDSYAHYGGRGIKVCERWDANDGTGYKNFLEDMGRKPASNYTLDRIDPDGDYCPENCRWASPKEQAMNKKNTTIIEWNGEKDSYTGWSKRLGIAIPSIKYNYEHGLPLNHRRNLCGIRYKGKTTAEWAKELDVKYGTLVLFLTKHNHDIDEAIEYYTSPSRRKYPWVNRPSEGGA